MKEVCDNCEESHLLLHCIECGYDLCQQCIQTIHQRGKFKQHIQVPIPKEDLESPQIQHKSLQLDKFSFGKDSGHVFQTEPPSDSRKKNFDLILKTQMEQEQSIFENNLKVFTCAQAMSQSQGGMSKVSVTQENRKSLNEFLVRQLSKGDNNAVVYDFYPDFQFDYMNIKHLLGIVKEEKKIFRFYFLIEEGNNQADLQLLQSMFKQEFNFHKKCVVFMTYLSGEQKGRKVAELSLLLRHTHLVFLISYDSMALCDQLQEEKRETEQQLSVVVIQRPEESSQEIKNFLCIRHSPRSKGPKSEISAFTFGQFTPKLLTEQFTFECKPEEYNIKSSAEQQTTTPSNQKGGVSSEVKHSSHHEMEIQFPINLDRDSFREKSEKTMNVKEESFCDKLQLDLSDMMEGTQRNKSDIGAKPQTSNNLKESLSNNNLRNSTNHVFLEQFSLQSSSIRFAAEDHVILENHQKFLDVSVSESLQLSYHLQNFLMHIAEEGQLFLEEAQFVQRYNAWGGEFKTSLEESAFPALVKECVQKKILQLVIRQFGNSQEYRFITMRLRSISYQAMVWVLRSLRSDRMSATEKNITNRFKEAFGYRLEPALWLTVIQRVQEEEFQIVIARFGFPSLAIKDGEVLLHDGAMVEAEDQGQLTSRDVPLWNAFLQFVDEFFDNKNKEKNSNLAEKRKWSTSIKSQSALDSSQSSTKKNQNLPPRSLDRAIPGGKYGCAQLLKFEGPQLLQQESLGKLNQVVGEAITRKVIVYFKTLLVKNNNLQKESRMLSAPVEEGQQTSIKDSYVKQKVEAVRTVIIKLLADHKQGIPLSKLPRYLQSQLDFTFDLHELGFSKLKSLLQVMEEVFIQNEDSSKAVLRAVEQQGGNKQHTQKKQQLKLEETSDNGSQQNKSWNGIIVTPKNFTNPKKFFVAPGSQQSSTMKKNDKIFNKQIENEIILSVQDLLANNQEFISMQVLESLLASQLPQHSPLDFDQLGYQDFNDFLFKKFKNIQSRVDAVTGNTMIRLQGDSAPLATASFYTPEHKHFPPIETTLNQVTSKFFKSCPQNKKASESNIDLMQGGMRVLFPQEHDMEDLQNQHEKSIIMNVLDHEEEQLQPQKKKPLSIQSRPAYGGEPFNQK